jgi:hypothetical protein
MQYIPTAEVKIDLTRALPEVQELILMVSLTQPNQHEFFKALDLWMGESLGKIEEQIKAHANSSSPPAQQPFRNTNSRPQNRKRRR